MAALGELRAESAVEAWAEVVAELAGRLAPAVQAEPVGDPALPDELLDAPAALVAVRGAPVVVVVAVRAGLAVAVVLDGSLAGPAWAGLLDVVLHDQPERDGKLHRSSGVHDWS